MINYSSSTPMHGGAHAFWGHDIAAEQTSDDQNLRKEWKVGNRVSVSGTINI